ncbi:MAG: TIGR00269 family protein [Candidatus Nanoarchaeia archaeon]|nr:TIGR00269 family protein [Candidatus Nanoarchaeia archaeon]
MSCKLCSKEPVITLTNNNVKLCKNCFFKYYESKVFKTIFKYKLFTKKDKVGVAVSGGKDSTVCLYVLKKLGYNVEAITIDAAIGNYTKSNLENIKKVCKDNKIKLHIISFRKEFGKSLCYIRDMLKEKGYEYSSCMLCGILKRYLLNKYSKKLKFDYLATGHCLDDEAEAFLMNIFRNDLNLARRQGIKSSSISSKFVRRVKPLYFMMNLENRKYSELKNFPVNYGICPCSVDAHRREFRNMLDKFEIKNPGVKNSILNFHENMKENLKEQKNIKINYCESCGELSSGKICKTCGLLSKLKK